ncbi:MAG: M20 family metallopeptidase [Bacteroidales bacterium]|jgi:amidohydrolase|nr:M20 family metallopeptidase [Bacteroidales bacterium]
MEKQALLNNAKTIHPEIIRIRRHLHKYPELSFQEKETQSFLIKELAKIGINKIEKNADTGIAVELDSGNPGSCIALRADMDALPIQEANIADYASVNDGIMHACGHDTHMSSLFGCLKLLNSNKSEWKGKVLAIFQPGEEMLPGGATKVIASGIFDKYKPRLIIGQHVMPGMPIGHFGFKAGPYMASTDEIYIKVSGKGGHAATPTLTKDTVACAAEMLLTLKSEIKSMAKDVPVVLGFGKLIADGSNNVIPSEVNMEGTFRSMDEAFRNYAKTQMHTILQSIANRYGTEVRLEIRDGYPSLTNNQEYTNDAKEYMQDLLTNRHVEEMDIRLTGEDFAYYSQKMPAIFYRFGIQGEKLGSVNVHNRFFDIDENALIYSTAGLAWLSIQFLNQFNS